MVTAPASTLTRMMPCAPLGKGTRQRIHSPKGRASLMREWLRGMSEQGVDVKKASYDSRHTSFISSFLPRLRNTLAKKKGEYDFSHEVHESMMGCLACKSCVGQCPIKVDVPEFRSKFLELYYSRYLRPLKDYAIGGLEYAMPALSVVPQPYNWIVGNRFLNHMISKMVGVEDSPKFSKHNLKREMARRGIRLATPLAIEALSPKDRKRAVIVVQDAFTSYFETELVLDMMELLSRLGFQAYIAPYMPNGKPLHVHGFLRSFEKTARKNLDMLQNLSFYGIPMIGIDPSMTLTYRSEYAKVFGTSRPIPKIQLMQEWLASQTKHLEKQAIAVKDETFHMMAHCTEKTNAAPSIQDWKKVFELLGLGLQVENVGCCGMAGTYGHESSNKATSVEIYDLSWKEKVNDPSLHGKLVATGYSCRCQAKRIDNKEIKHPAQVLLDHIKSDLS